MEPTKTQEQKKPAVLVIIIILLCLIICAGAAYIIMSRRGEPQEVQEPSKIGYSEGVVLLEGAEPPEYTPPEYITLEYDGQATSKDGKTFQCNIANAKENQYDMYIDMYADAELTDEIFLSQLFKPGTGFKEITLNRALEKGTHLVYLVFTQVEDGQTAIHNQTTVTLNMIVE